MGSGGTARAFLFDARLVSTAGTTWIRIPSRPPWISAVASGPDRLARG